MSNNKQSKAQLGLSVRAGFSLEHLQCINSKQQVVKCKESRWVKFGRVCQDPPSLLGQMANFIAVAAVTCTQHHQPWSTARNG